MQAPAAAPAAKGPCAAETYNGADYVVCRFDPAESDIRLFLNNADGEPYGHFNFLKDALAKENETLVFAMNAGMYHEDRSPVGLYIEGGDQLAPANINDGPGNFHMKPNGVFWLQTSQYADPPEKRAFVTTTEYFLEGAHFVTDATQSGPMLVMDGRIHPTFLPDSDSLKRRNGVGVTEDGKVIFVLADTPVRLYDFALLFRDELKTPNALYLDGTISRLYAPDLDRNDPGLPMGPIVGVVAGQ